MKVVALGLRGFPGIQGGVETHCEQLYTRIAAKGHDVIVFGRRRYTTDAPRTFKRVRLIWLFSPPSAFLEAIIHTFLGTIAAFFLRPDVLHIHAIGPSLMVPLGRLLGMRVVTTNHGPDYDRPKWGTFSKRILRFGEKFGGRWSNQVISISRPIAEHLQSAFQRDSIIIPNGVEVKVPAERHDEIDALGLVRQRYVLAVGRLVPEKGFHDLIDAFVAADLPGWKLVIVGRADHENDYSIALKEKARRNPSILMTGFLGGEPLHQLYTHAGLFVLPSYHEGFPIVMLEAMSYGLPVVASDIEGNRVLELANDCYFDVGLVPMLTQRLRAETSRPVDLDERDRRIASIRSRFDWDLIADATIRVFQQVTRPRNGA
jgi:glycosyltransferase involved in cell wall biosynthesis